MPSFVYVEVLFTMANNQTSKGRTTGVQKLKWASCTFLYPIVNWDNYKWVAAVPRHLLVTLIDMGRKVWIGCWYCCARCVAATVWQETSTCETVRESTADGCCAYRRW